MTPSTIQVLAPLTVRVPRAARWIESLAGWLSTPLRAAPALPEDLSDAAEVRKMAYNVQESDPGFAADLLAAAARHEGRRDR